MQLVENRISNPACFMITANMLYKKETTCWSVPDQLYRTMIGVESADGERNVKLELLDTTYSQVCCSKERHRNRWVWLGQWLGVSAGSHQCVRARLEMIFIQCLGPLRMKIDQPGDMASRSGYAQIRAFWLYVKWLAGEFLCSVSGEFLCPVNYPKGRHCVVISFLL